MKIFDHCVAVSQCLGMIMSRQHTALLLRENVNDVKSSTNLHQKKQSILFQNPLFFEIEQVESANGENLGRSRIWGGQDLRSITN